MYEQLRRLCGAPGVSGRESPVADIIKEEIGSAAECRTDSMGNLLVFRRGAARPKQKVMFCAHMDEVGLMVTYVTPEGLLRFSPVGGIDPRVVLGRRVRLSQNGRPGVIATKAIHLQSAEERKTSPDFDSLYIDIGAETREEALNYAAPGDPACFDSDFVEFGDGMLKARALDDRAGCSVLLGLIRSELPYDCWFAFTVQEEVGARGAGPAAFSTRPDIAVVMEATTAADVPFVEKGREVCRLGKGPAISFMDGGTLYDRELFARACHAAGEKDIPYQIRQGVTGGNDAGAIHTAAGGVRVAAVSVPCRYLHSPSCVIRADDLEHTSRLARELAAVFPAL